MPHLQLKDIPAGTHEALRARATRDGISMREYVLRLIEADVGRMDAWGETLRKVREAPGPPLDPADVVEAIRVGREEREEQLLAAISRYG